MKIKYVVLAQIIFGVAYSAPERISDLRVLSKTSSSITLAWTVPASSEPLVGYSLRFNTGGMISFRWNSYDQAENVPDPNQESETQTATVTGLEADKRYYFAIKTQDESGLWSIQSNQATEETDAPKPSNNAKFIWLPNQEPDVGGYRIYYGTPPGNYTTVTNVGNVTRAEIGHLTIGETYSFYATCYNIAGLESDPSDIVTFPIEGGALGNPTIDWSKPDDMTYGERLGSRQLNARALYENKTVSGTYVYDPPSGQTLPVGNNHTLSVSFFPRDTNSFGIATASTTVNVGKAVLTISARDYKKIYGRSMPKISPYYRGFVSGDNTASLLTQVVLETSATDRSPVGNYPITVSGASSENYDILFENGTITVSPAPLAIVPRSLWRYRFAQNPVLEANYSGLASWESPGVLIPPVVISTTAVRDSEPGYYPIKVSKTDNPNYTITYREGKLRVVNLTKPVISITPSYPSANVGDTLPFTATFLRTNGVETDITMDCEWVSWNRSIATIDNSGITTCLKNGRVLISANYEGVRGLTTLIIVTASETEEVGTSIALPTTLESIIEGIGEDEVFIRVSGPAGTMIVLEKTGDWQSWYQSSSGMIGSDGNLFLTDNTDGFSRTFYRVLKIPELSQ